MSQGIIRRGVSHAQLSVRIQGITIGWVQGFRFDESYTQFPIKVLGDVFTQAHELVDVSVSGSCDKFRIFTEPLVHLGTSGIPNDGNRLWYDQSLDTAKLISVLEKEMVLATNDDPSSQPLYTVVGFKPTGRSVSIQQGAVMMENFNWVALRVLESNVALAPIPT